MKYSYWGLGLIMLGFFGVVFLVMFESITINDESSYYVLKEAMEAAMLESVDLACYRIGEDYCTEINGRKQCGCGEDEVKIIEQKFVENFTRRFATSISGDATKYKLEFYDIIESPPKATVVIKSETQEYWFGKKDTKGSFTIVNDLSGILELYH